MSGNEEEEGGGIQWLVTFGKRNYRRIIPFVFILLLLGVELVTPGQKYVSWQSVALIGILLVLIFLNEIDVLDVPGVGRVGLQGQQQQIAEAQMMLNEMRRSSDTTAGDEEADIEEEATPEGEYDDEGVTVEDDRVPLSSRDSRFYTGATGDEISEEIYNIAQGNPKMALVKLRSEIEGAARELAEKRDHGPIRSNQNLLDVLRRDDRVQEDIVDTYADVREVYNQTIHGGDVNFGDVLEAIDVGIDLLNYIQSVGYDDELVSGKTYWTGLDLLVQFKTASPGTTFDLRSANEEIGALVMQFRVDENGEYVIQSDEIGSGTYVICQGQNPVQLLDNGKGDSSVDLALAKFEFVDQTLRANFERSVVVNDGNQTATELSIESNRASFVVWVGCDALEMKELESIFVENSNFIGAFDNVEARYVAFRCQSGQKFNADFTGIDLGEYEFNLMVPDTHAQTFANVTVRET